MSAYRVILALENFARDKRGDNPYDVAITLRSGLRIVGHPQTADNANYLRLDEWEDDKPDPSTTHYIPYSSIDMVTPIWL